MSLTREEYGQFDDLGYVVKPGVFSAADLKPIQGAMTRIVDDEARKLRAEGLLDEIFEGEAFGRRFARILRHNPDAGRRIYASILGKGGGGFAGPEIFNMIVHPPLLDCIESLIGPEIIGCSAYRIRPKLPHWDHGEVPWHQDSGYFMSHCDRYLVVTCWIPLVDATLDNGCLYVVPGVHKDGILRHYTGGHGGFLEIPVDELPRADRAVPVEMKAGDVLFMTNHTPHASFANSTDDVRWSVDLRYQNAEAPTNALESPEDYTPERDPVTMACYPPEADFIIRSPSHPEHEVRTAGQFHALRKRFETAGVGMPGRGWTPLKAKAAP